MARNIYVVFLNDLGTSELGQLIPFWIKEVAPLGGYVFCRKSESDDHYLNLLVDSENFFGQSVEFEMRIPNGYVRAIVKASDLERIGIVGIS